ncbi:Putative gustatory receptor 64f [Acromyrmex echinatior]|uniref:Putative gustatory receptor 64f n=1 Tax=Acromyrmex echinatior TaxID=103372 RepID=F4WZ04_ACREC|nr:Putative gustatory receptor 64f [Acromyrmex echinatior]
MQDPESFHCVMGPVLVMAQLFGILPVSGILMPSPLQIEFVKFSVRTIYSVFISGMVLFMATLSIIHMIKTLDSTTFEVQEGIVAATSGAIFYVNCVMGLIIFFWLSSRWVNLQRDWRSMELFIDRKSNNGIISDIYFFESFLFLIGRTMIVTLLTARIHDQSKVILPILFTCSASTYDKETERLLHLLSTDNITLTGMRFFSITRNFLLAVKTNQDLIKNSLAFHMQYDSFL